MNQQECKILLRDQFLKDIDQKDNISKLTNDAWGTGKSFCIGEMGGTKEVVGFLANIQKNKNISLTGTTSSTQDSQTISGSQNSTSSAQIQTQTQSSSDSFFSSFSQDISSGLGGPVKIWGGYFLLVVLGIFLLYFALNGIRYMLRFLYDVFNSHRMIYLKVTMSRGDGKVDREQEKELAKDMKEKIGRMTQVFHNMHKLGELSFHDHMMYAIFRKPKVTMIYHYEDGLLSFIVATYPEYQQIVEGGISAQYPTTSIELIDKPKFFPKKYRDIVPMEPVKPSVFNIKIFKNQPDDPMNNIVDSIAKISKYDTVTLMMPIKPLSQEFNKKAQKWAEGLYRNDSNFTNPNREYAQWLLKPFQLIGFLIWGKEKKQSPDNKDVEVAGGKDYVRMVKAKEDYLNAMGEEAALPFFEAGLLVMTSSDDKEHIEHNIDLMVSAFTVYGDEYGNELDDPEQKADIFGRFFKPLWKIATIFHLTHFFFKNNDFGVNELASVYHFPDSTYNRAPVIGWMQYKILPPPDDLPVMKDENGYIMTGILAEKYKKGVLSDILQDHKKHRAIAEKVISEEKLEPIEKFSQKDLAGKEIVEKDGKQLVKTMVDKKVLGYKMYRDGVLLGVNIYRNQYSPVYMKKNDRTRHHYCIGKSGTGKSVFLQTLARQDIWSGDGVCVIDPHGDLVEDMLMYVPKERAKDVIFFDAGDEVRPMGLNLYEIASIDEADRTVNDATEIFLKMFGPEIFGPRIQEYFKYGSLTLMEDFEDKPTLLDVPRLFTDDGYRDYKVKKVQNPVVKNFREKTYNAMGDREKQEIIPYFTSKFVSFNTNRLIRNIIGQTKSGFNFQDVMDNKKILLISLSKGKIGEINAQLLGMIIVSKIYNAAMARARMEESLRKDFYLYVDEFQNFVSGTFADILSEARKYKLSLIMAHQYIAQLESGGGNNLGDKGGGKGDVKAAVFGNVGTMMSFKIGAPDAEFMEKEYTPVLSAQDIVGIANYKAYVKLNINNATTRVFSMNSIYTGDYKNKKIAPILKEYSAKKYGRKREFVDAEIAARLGLGVEEEKLETPPEEPTQS